MRFICSGEMVVKILWCQFPLCAVGQHSVGQQEADVTEIQLGKDTY